MERHKIKKPLDQEQEKDFLEIPFCREVKKPFSVMPKESHLN